jgi:primosomal protein N' (replication factor Y)
MPDFRIGEKVFRLLLSLREKATEHFLIQTRDPDLPLFALAAAGNIGEFVRAELEIRKKLSYPPFSTLIKFTHSGGRPEGKVAMAEIEKLFSLYHPVSFPGFIAKVKNKFIMNALIKIPSSEDGKQRDWPNDELLSLIRSLPTEISVRVDPESVI